jgi:hypothetical protein
LYGVEKCKMSEKVYSGSLKENHYVGDLEING